jgi:hypothetical protein
MTRSTKQRLFNVAFGGAGLLYLWSLFVFWMAPRWELSESMYLLTGILPAMLGVVALILALGLHLDLRRRDD